LKNALTPKASEFKVFSVRHITPNLYESYHIERVG
jgi:hypothetical protein